MTLSKYKTMEIANVCYANVSSRFAIFHNPRMRGPNFTWEWWVDHCESSAEDWVFIHNIKGPREEVVKLARSQSREIAEYLVKMMLS